MYWYLNLTLFTYISDIFHISTHRYNPFYWFLNLTVGIYKNASILPLLMNLWIISRLLLLWKSSEEYPCICICAPLCVQILFVGWMPRSKTVGSKYMYKKMLSYCESANFVSVYSHQNNVWVGLFFYWQTLNILKHIFATLVYGKLYLFITSF